MTKIMLVEDDKSLREIYSIRLVAEGYDIVSAGDGEEALALAVQEKPELIVSDVMMPKISGFDMLDILRSTPETSKIKVIMMTALSSDDQRMRGESLGADRYLVKSQVGIEDVINTVHEVLGDKSTANAATNLEVASATTAAPAPAAEPVPAAAPVIPQNPAEAPAAPAATAPVAPAPIPTPVAQPAAAPAPIAPQPIIPQNPATPAAPVAPAPIPTPVAQPAAAPAPVIPNAPAPAPQPVAPAPAPAPAPAAPGGGERVIQPLNDPNSATNREEMQRKMDELLGNVPTEQSRPTPVEAPETTEAVDPNAVQPGYIQNLASDLNRDMQGGETAAPDSMEARMTADLKDDPLTQQAQAMPAPAPEAQEQPAEPAAYNTDAQA